MASADRKPGVKSEPNMLQFKVTHYHLVVLISRDPFWTAVITREPIMASLRETRESGFEPTPLHRIAGDFLRKELEAAGFRLWQCCMARISIRCSKSIPNPALRHSKEAAA